MSAKNFKPKISFVPRLDSNRFAKVEPVDYSSERIVPTVPRRGSRSFSSSTPRTTSESVRQTLKQPDELKTETTTNDLGKQKNISTIKCESIPGSPETLEHRYGQQTCFKRTSIIVIVLILIGIVAIVIPLAIVFGTPRTKEESSFTNMTASVCSKSTCIGQETPYHSSITTYLYMLDGNTQSTIGSNSGVGTGSPSPSLNAAGYAGQSISLNATNNQCVIIPPMNFAERSFTIQLWFYINLPTITMELGLFSQCDSDSTCLSLGIQNEHLTFWLDSTNPNSIPLIGNSLIPVYVWTHVTIIYDAILFQQRLYINGDIDAVSTGIVFPYQGVTSLATTTIGRSESITGSSYFSGRIDHLMISLNTVRSICQIDNDATLFAYYPFDNTYSFNDYSVYQSNGISKGISIVSNGRINQAISFSFAISFVQVPYLNSYRVRTSSYTVSLWIKPNITMNGGSLIHISTTINGGTGVCYDLLAFTASGALAAQHMGTGSKLIGIQSPLITKDVWTHVVMKASSLNGLRLYINGQLKSMSTNTSGFIYYEPGNSIAYATLGNTNQLGLGTASNCNTSNISVVSGPYNGLIDDFRIYNRDITADELCLLANP